MATKKQAKPADLPKTKSTYVRPTRAKDVVAARAAAKKAALIDAIHRDAMNGILHLGGGRKMEFTKVIKTGGIRDCVDCELPFFSRSTANVVCLPCREASTAEFEGDV